MTGDRPPDWLTSVEPAGEHRSAEVLVPDGAPYADLLAMAEAEFAADEALELVVVVTPGGRRHVVSRDALLDALESLVKGIDFGASDHLVLPGDPGRLSPIRLSCPVDGEVFTAYFLDPGERRRCPRHTASVLDVRAPA